ncbi:hypothetical protein E3N88_12252 [Mikania micrantha]|uniref:t-SNARE coiled-coil homology domain-containing protein n=1 Tax=Mikania micrantha TaxID=192012 RepID=A0A5N6P702_9ASTR|nr:hypothetical protein E3N88_12252 [Mikania micrantha]
MESSSTNYKYHKSEQAIEILVKDIRSNISSLSEMLDETEEDGGVIAREYMIKQLEINEEIHGDVKLFHDGTIDKMKKKREAVGVIKYC